MILLLFLLLLAILVSFYDHSYARIPNWVSLPLIILGILVNTPLSGYVFFFGVSFFIAWRADWMGGGDAKFWIGILCILPTNPATLWALPLTFFSTALIQLLWRKMRGEIIRGRRTQAAWRTVVYLLVLVSSYAY
jgi:Flp pilus assembly protein protease CpaA